MRGWLSWCDKEGGWLSPAQVLSWLRPRFCCLPACVEAESTSEHDGRERMIRGRGHDFSKQNGRHIPRAAGGRGSRLIGRGREWDVKDEKEGERDKIDCRKAGIGIRSGNVELEGLGVT